MAFFPTGPDKTAPSTANTPSVATTPSVWTPPSAATTPSDATTPDGSSTDGPTTPSGPIGQLSTGLTQIKDSGPVDLKLSTETRDQYLAAIASFRSTLQGQRAAMNAIAPLGSPGTLRSALQTKANLELNVTGMGGITDTMDQYLLYLDDLSDAVTKAASRLIQSG